MIDFALAQVRRVSRPRNPLIAQNLREFPVAPNIDPGGGVKMMFAEMAGARLYPLRSSTLMRIMWDE